MVERNRGEEGGGGGGGEQEEEKGEGKVTVGEGVQSAV